MDIIIFARMYILAYVPYFSESVSEKSVELYIMIYYEVEGISSAITTT